MDLSKCSCSRNAVLPVFSTRPTSRVYGWFLCGRVQHIVWYSANNTHLTLYVVWQSVSNELHMLQFGSHQTLGYATRFQKRERRLLQTIALRYAMCVMLLCYLERQLLVVHYTCCHVVQSRHSVLLTCIVKPARHYGRQTLLSLYIAVSVVLLWI